MLFLCPGGSPSAIPRHVLFAVHFDHIYPSFIPKPLTLYIYTVSLAGISAVLLPPKLCVPMHGEIINLRQSRRFENREPLEAVGKPWVT
jgi:hypothetical protein